MNINYKRTILSTTLWTLLSLVLATLVLFLFMFFIFPKSLGNFCYSIGLEGMSANLYYKDYEKSNDIYCLYKSLNIEIKYKNNDKIIKYYVEFTEDDEYTNFLSSYKTRNEKLDIGILEKSTMLNEENYLANKYISSLLATEQNSKAFNLAINYFANYKDFTFTNQGVYLFSHFIEDEDFSRVPAGYSQTILQSMQEYFNSCVDLFNSKINTESDLEKAYLISLGNRIIEVGGDINALYKGEGISTEENSLKMTNVNESIKGLL